MSHFPLIVAGTDVDAQLAPFNENLKVSPYLHTGWSEAHVLEHVQMFISQGTPESFAMEPLISPLMEDMVDLGYVEGVRRNEEAFKTWANVFVGLPYNDRYQFLTQRNPKGKWDDYKLGGRWASYFKLRPGEIGLRYDGTASEPGGYAEICLFGDIDLRGMAAMALRQARQNWRQTNRPDPLGRHYEYHIAPGMSRQAYLAQQKKAAILPHAFLKDGQWHEQGRMGTSSVKQNVKILEHWIEEFNDLFYSLPADTPVSIIDCHR